MTYKKVIENIKKKGSIMGIFTANEILFFCLGVLGTSLTTILIYLRKTLPFRWHSTALAASGILLALFTIAWAVSSILENEARASGMGLLIFGVTVLICFGLARHLVVKEMKLIMASSTDSQQV